MDNTLENKNHMSQTYYVIASVFVKVFMSFHSLQCTVIDQMNERQNFVLRNLNCLNKYYGV